MSVLGRYADEEMSAEEEIRRCRRRFCAWRRRELEREYGWEIVGKETKGRPGQPRAKPTKEPSMKTERVEEMTKEDRIEDSIK